MKGCSLINITFLILCASCKDLNVKFKEIYDYLITDWAKTSSSWLNWPYIVLAAVCIPVAIFGSLYVYRNGWHSLLPQSWRKSDK